MRHIYISLVLIVNLVFSVNLYAGTISFDQLVVSGDLTVAKYNADMDRIYQQFNSTVEASNILDNTLTEADQSDDINPRIRTFEGASCEKVDDGLLPATGGSLTQNISAGTGYPRGFRCDITSATGHTYTASRWTFVDIDQGCDFQFAEVAIEGATPALAVNSIRLARVSSDGATIATVTDLRNLNCATGPFNAIDDVSSEATLGDLFRIGRPTRGHTRWASATQGWMQGLQVSWDTHTQFRVLTGGMVTTTGRYRVASSDLTVGTGNDNPSQGTSGLDTGSISASTRYFVYAVADQDSVSTLSSSYSTNATTPTGVNHFRIIGSIATDANSLFISRDIFQAHSVGYRELAGGWVHFDGTGSTLVSIDAFNVSSIIDNGTGRYTITWDADFNNVNYVVVAGGTTVTSTEPTICGSLGNETTDTDINCLAHAGGVTNCQICQIVAFGDTRR